MSVAMPSDDVLVSLWRGGQTADRIAYELHLPLAVLYRNWRRLKQEGRLPDRSRAPIRELHRNHKYEPAVFGNDGRPTVGDDELLMRLQREHGSDGSASPA